MTSSDKLVAILVTEHNVKIDDANALIDVFDEIDWENHTAIRRLRRMAKSLLGEIKGETVFGLLRQNAAKLSPAT